eukprot:4777205-Pleurochrysis_carterae.AAC.5
MSIAFVKAGHVTIRKPGWRNPRDPMIILPSALHPSRLAWLLCPRTFVLYHALWLKLRWARSPASKLLIAFGYHYK